MRRLTEDGRRSLESDKQKGNVPCDKYCSICYEDVPDPDPEQYTRLGFDHGVTVAKNEVQRLTLENSLLKGELALLKSGRDLSK